LLDHGPDCRRIDETRPALPRVARRRAIVHKVADDASLSGAGQSSLAFLASMQS